MNVMEVGVELWRKNRDAWGGVTLSLSLSTTRSQLCYLLSSGVMNQQLNCVNYDLLLKGQGKAKCPKKMAQKRVVLSLTIILYR